MTFNRGSGLNRSIPFNRGRWERHQVKVTDCLLVATVKDADLSAEIAADDTVYPFIGAELAGPVSGDRTKTVSASICPMVSGEPQNVGATISADDTLYPCISGVGWLGAVNIPASDTLYIAPDIDERYDYDATIRVSDSLTLAPDLDNSVAIQNVFTRCSEDRRYIRARVKITYSDPLLDESIEVIGSSDTAYGTYPSQTADNVFTSKYKWFAVGAATLGQGFSIGPDEEDITSIGWWSADFSDGDAEFTTPVGIIATLASTRPVYTLQLYGDQILGGFPVDFEIKLYDSEDVLLETIPVTDNTEVEWSQELESPVLDVKKISLSVSKISTANDQCRVAEFFTAHAEWYYEDDLISIDLLEELDYNSGSLPIGNISSNEVVINLYNKDRRFNVNNPDSPVRDLMLKNRRIEVWLGVAIVEGTNEWYKVGEYWSQDWEAPEDDQYVEVRGLDRLDRLRHSFFNPATIYRDYSLKDLAELVLSDAGLTSEQYLVDDELDTVTVDYAWFDKMSHRAALKRIAQAGLAVCFCDREGRIIMKLFENEANSRWTFDTDSNIFNKTNPLAWDEMVNAIEIIATPRKPGIEEVLYEDTDEIEVPAGETVSRFYMFNFSPVIDLQEPEITQSGADIIINDYTEYSWAMEVVFENTGVTPQSVTSIKISGKKLDKTGGLVATAENDESIRANGRIELTSGFESDLIQTKARAQAIADSLIASYSDPRRDIDMETRGLILLEVGHRVTAPDYEGVYNDFGIVRQETHWDGGLTTRILGRRIVT